jgi:hypothetical protein
MIIIPHRGAKVENCANPRLYPQIPQISQIGKAFGVWVFHPNPELPLT